MWINLYFGTQIENRTVMVKNSRRFLVFVFVMLAVVPTFLKAQNTTLTTDELFAEARAIPKEKANYPKITNLLNQALTKSPNYIDVRMFLGRVYTWDDNLDSARFQFNQVLAVEPGNVEATVAIFDLEYWNDNYQRAYDHANLGLLQNPDASDLVLRKAKAMVALERTENAVSFLKDYVQRHSDDLQNQAYLSSLQKTNAKNQLDLGYEFVYFDKRFSDPWHYTSLGYTRNTGIGSISANLLYSNRFRTNGFAAELEAYPSITKGIYAYLGFGFSNSPTFYHYRGGLSLYYSLPRSFDAETGVRYLNFNPSETYIYVLALGKYISNYYINLKTYLTPGQNATSQSLTLSVKYFFSDRFNSLGFQVGTGVSPDDRLRNLIGTGNFRSYKAGMSYAKDLRKNFNISFSGLWYYEEYYTNSWGNQLGLGVSLMKKF